MKKRTFVGFVSILYGAEKRNRTPNLLITIQLLCQLSYFGVVTLVGFEPTHAGVRVQSLSTWPQGSTNKFYQIFNKDHEAKLTLTPIINFRDFHADTYNHEFKVKQEQINNKLKVIVDDNSNTPIYINVSEGNYIEHNQDVFRNMFYIFCSLACGNDYICFF